MNLAINPLNKHSKPNFDKKLPDVNSNIGFRGNTAKIPLISYPKNYYVAKNQISFKGLEQDDPIKWAQQWDYTRAKAKFDSDAVKEIGNKWFGKKKIQAKHQMLFQAEQTKVTHILQTVKHTQDRLDKADNKELSAKEQARVNEEARKELDLMDRLKQRIDSRINDPKASINQSIAGYKPQKERIRDGFLGPIQLEDEYVKKYNSLKRKAGVSDAELEEARSKAENVSIPPSALFYGCFGTGKTTFARAIAAETDCHCEEYDPANEDYNKFIQRALRESKERYLTEGKRTIILINEVEDYLNKSLDMNIRKNVADMKSLLDYCSHKPKDGQNGACATFFFTTNFPADLLYTGILGRKGKMPLVVPVEPASGEDLKEVVKFHAKRVMPDKTVFDAENYDYGEILKKLELTEEKGGYSNDRIAFAMDEIRNSYDRDPQKGFRAHLEESILNDKCRALKLRDISPELYVQYYNDYETIGEG